jgi:hypothetical protein
MEESAFYREAEEILLELGKLVTPAAKAPEAAKSPGSS